MQFDNSSAFQIKKCSCLTGLSIAALFISNLSCFFKSFCFRSCAFITHYIYYDASNPDGRAFTAAVFRLQGKCDTTLRGSARCHPPCRYPEFSSGCVTPAIVPECLPDGAGSMRLRSHSVMHHIFLKAHPIPGSAPEIFHFR